MLWIPTLTISGLPLAQLLGGTVVIETIFAWPGIGLALYQPLLHETFRSSGQDSHSGD